MSGPTRQWNPMTTAPRDASEVLVLTRDGRELVAHWADDSSGEEQPAFRGWFRAVVNRDSGRVLYYAQIDTPVGWLPKDAQ